MKHSLFGHAHCVVLLCFGIGFAAAATAQAPDASSTEVATIPVVELEQKTANNKTEASVQLEPLTVTASRLRQTIESTAASVTVVSGEQLRARGSHDLHTALAGVAGVEISHGGDNGPGGAVPSFMGLREFDAFLLVVDDIPAGGAFNPALTTLDLNNVERIEVLRGAAPVMYGATSFVGVIHVIHYPAGKSSETATVGYGSTHEHPGTIFGDISKALPSLGGWQHSLSLNGERDRLDDSTAGLRKGHGRYRGAIAFGAGSLGLDLDITTLRQKPDSPVLLEGTELTTQTPLDANHNPLDGVLKELRHQAALHFTLPLGEQVSWLTTASTAFTSARTIRGYLNLTPDRAPDFFESTFGFDPGMVIRDPNQLVNPTSQNATGYSQQRNYRDNYADTHLLVELTPSLQLAIGGDLLTGVANQSGSTYAYSVGLDGSNRPNSTDSSNTLLESGYIVDDRHFYGGYLQLGWRPLTTLHVDAGLRYNRTREHKYGLEVPSAADPDMPAGAPIAGDLTRDVGRYSGTAGVNWRFLTVGENHFTAYADYRDSFKPAAFEFGPEFEVFILNPETAKSKEVGLKNHFLGGTLDLDLSVFDMDFKKVVVAESTGFFNIGRTRLQGAEMEADYHVTRHSKLLASYALHKATYREGQDEDGSDLKGKHLALSPRNTGSLGVQVDSNGGLFGSVLYSYVSSRALTIDNAARTGAYGEVGASLGYAGHYGRVSLNGYNLGNRRDPVTASEFGEVLTGDSQFFRTAGRTLAVVLSLNI